MRLEREYTDIGAITDIPRLGARTVKTPSGDIAIFRNAQDEVFALRDQCPHKKGPVSQGIVHGITVTCPLHGWVISLQTGQAQGLDSGCTRQYDVKIENGRVMLAATDA